MDSGEAGDPMSAAVLEPTYLAERMEERDRRARVAQAIREGQRPASADTRPGEFFTQVPVPDLLALTHAQRLSGAELRFTLAVIARTYRTGAYATLDVGSDKPPRLADWVQWLGLRTIQQAHNIRERLHSKGVLTYVEGDARKLAFNAQWETWEASMFTHQEARTGSGRPRKTKLASLLVEPSPEKSTPEFTENKLGSLLSPTEKLTPKFTRDATQPRRRAASEQVAIDTNYKRDNIQTDAIASGVSLDATTPATPLSALDVVAASPPSPAPATPTAPSHSQERLQERPSNTPSAAPKQSQASRATRPARPRKLTDEQLAVHNAEQAYISQLIERLKAVVGLKGALPLEGRERKDARFFLTAGAEGGMAPLDDVVACYEVLKGDSFWRHQPIGTGRLGQFYVEYRQDPEQFRQDHAPKATLDRRNTSGGFGMRRGGAQDGPGTGSNGTHGASGRRVAAERAAATPGVRHPHEPERPARGGRWIPGQGLVDG